MNITTLPIGASSPSQQVVLAAANEIDRLLAGSLVAASAKTTGSIVAHPKVLNQVVLNVGKLTAEDCLLAGRQLAISLSAHDQNLLVDCTGLVDSNDREPSETTPGARLSNFVRGLFVGTNQVDLWKGERPSPLLADTEIALTWERTDMSDADIARAIAEGEAVALGQLAAMHLVDRPANAKRPTDVATICDRSRADIRVRRRSSRFRSARDSGIRRDLRRRQGERPPALFTEAAATERPYPTTTSGSSARA